MALLQSRTRS